MWSSIYDTSYPIMTNNDSVNDLGMLNNYLLQDNLYNQESAPLVAPLMVPEMQNGNSMDTSGHRLSLEIQPCISVTEPTPVGMTMPSMDLVDQLIADASPMMATDYIDQNIVINPMDPFLGDFLQTDQACEAEWLSWTPTIQLSPALSVSTTDDFDHHSAHSLDLFLPPVTEDLFSLQPPSPPRSRRLSEPPTERPKSSNSTVRRTQSEKRRRAHSAASSSNTGHFPCTFPDCGKVFNRPYNLLSHTRTHTSEKPFACTQCGRKFARQHDRNRHEKLHWGIKPFACQFCQKAFARMDALNRHLRVENGCATKGCHHHTLPL
ncbi:hypothetical protein BY458DRAFT_496391 [Sporodiniella umbellata]|nr:hypothetical protein BY458DRAFT_496391 [Sporodiniella umbellata]